MMESVKLSRAVGTVEIFRGVYIEIPNKIPGKIHQLMMHLCFGWNFTRWKDADGEKSLSD